MLECDSATGDTASTGSPDFCLQLHIYMQLYSLTIACSVRMNCAHNQRCNQSSLTHRHTYPRSLRLHLPVLHIPHAAASTCERPYHQDGTCSHSGHRSQTWSSSASTSEGDQLGSLNAAHHHFCSFVVDATVAAAEWVGVCLLMM